MYCAAEFLIYGRTLIGFSCVLLSLHLKPHVKELTYAQSLQLRFRMLRMSDIRRHEISIYSRRQHGGRLGFGEKRKFIQNISS